MFFLTLAQDFIRQVEESERCLIWNGIDWTCLDGEKIIANILNKDKPFADTVVGFWRIEENAQYLESSGKKYFPSQIVSWKKIEAVENSYREKMLCLFDEFNNGDSGIKVKAYTDGYTGGDNTKSGVEFMFEDDICYESRECRPGSYGHPSVVIETKGDWELNTLIDSLVGAASMLKRLTKMNNNIDFQESDQP